MTDKFRDCFVGENGYDTLRKLMKSGNEFCMDISKCLQERNEAETAYVKALRKNSETLVKLAGRTKGTLSQAFKVIATQTNKECEAHNLIANALLNDISIPMRNLAETQAKERKSVEETLNEKLKEWNDKKNTDNKYRSSQFEKSTEIEKSYIKMSELSKTGNRVGKTTGKESLVSTTMVMSCVLPSGRSTSASEKLEISIQKLEEELQNVEKKYHESTKNVELARQSCAREMCRVCDRLEKMELDRISKMAKFIQVYVDSIQKLSQTTNQIWQDLNSIRISPAEDMIIEARSNLQRAEIEILLYDIYAEHEPSAMHEQRRILSLMKWMQMLKRDIALQQSTSHESISSLPSTLPHISREEQSPEDDASSSSDGAMCSASSHTRAVRTGSYRDGSISSSNDDDDGSMRHEKSKAHTKRIEGLSTEIHSDQSSIHLLQYLYTASLHKIESVYNYIKRLPPPVYEYEHFLTKTFNEKGHPTTLIRIPLQTASSYTSPSAPSITACLVEAIPVFPSAPMPEQTYMYSTQQQASSINWPENSTQMRRIESENSILTKTAVYPNLMQQPEQFPASKPRKLVKAIFAYKAKHADELSFEPNDIIILIKRRKDEWCLGNLQGKIGLFPGNYVDDA